MKPKYIAAILVAIGMSMIGFVVYSLNGQPPKPTPEAAQSTPSNAAMSASANAGTSAPQKEMAKSQSDSVQTGTDIQRSSIQNIIANDHRFSGCLVSDFYWWHRDDQPAALSNFVSTARGEDALTAPPVYRWLRRSGYVHFDGEGDYTVESGYFTVTSKGEAEIGKGIEQTVLRSVDLSLDGSRKQTWYRWRLPIACRTLVQIDSMTPLADGMKAEFSWRWTPTPVGEGAGVDAGRNRGEAYLVNRGNAMSLDQIYIKDSKGTY